MERRFATAVAECWLAARMVVWLAVLPVLKRLVPLPRLAALVYARPRERRMRPPVDGARVCRLAAGLSRRLLPPTRGVCLERSLVMYRFLAAEGANPELVIGVGQTEGKTIAHAWVLLDGQLVGDSSAALLGLMPIVAFGRDGAIYGQGQLARFTP